MPHQVAVTVRASLRAGQQGEVEALLVRLRTQGYGPGPLPFSQMPAVHFARLFVFDSVEDPDGPPIPAALVYMADVDGRAEEHLQALVRQARPTVDELFGHCENYPTGPTDTQRVAWLEQHSLRPLAYYVHTVGRTVRQILNEAQLHDEIGDLLDSLAPAPGERSSRAVRRHLQHLVLARSHLAWAARRAAGPGVGHRMRETAHLVSVSLLIAATLPVTVPVAIAGLVLIRWREMRDPVDVGPADVNRLHEIQSYEDFGAQNPFTAVGFVKPGLLRGVTMQIALRGLDFASRHVFGRDNLAGVRSIHFARWIPLDGGRRLVFASSYDGSVESYQDDFIDRVHWGVNLVFSNGVGYPRTRWLLGGGARDEVAYKHHLRRRQVPTPVFYAAYATLPAPNIDMNSRIRSGLVRAQDESETERYLAAL